MSHHVDAGGDVAARVICQHHRTNFKCLIGIIGHWRVMINL